MTDWCIVANSVPDSELALRALFQTIAKDACGPQSANEPHNNFKLSALCTFFTRNL
jgi:hypothetical protein